MDENIKKKLNELKMLKSMNYSSDELMADAYSQGFEAGMRTILNMWEGCFLSCSSPYCTNYFRGIRMTGCLGDMSKRKVE